jgi:hypothetical protein
MRSFESVLHRDAIAAMDHTSVSPSNKKKHTDRKNVNLGKGAMEPRSRTVVSDNPPIREANLLLIDFVSGILYQVQYPCRSYNESMTCKVRVGVR